MQFANVVIFHKQSLIYFYTFGHFSVHISSNIDSPFKVVPYKNSFKPYHLSAPGSMFILIEFAWKCLQVCRPVLLFAQACTKNNYYISKKATVKKLVTTLLWTFLAMAIIVFYSNIFLYIVALLCGDIFFDHLLWWYFKHTCPHLQNWQ